MKKSLVAFAISFALSAPALAADAPASAIDLKALDARIRALETEAQKLREQAAAALAEASAARAELDKMKTDQAAQAVAAPATPPPSATAAQESAVAAVTAPAESSSPSGGGANGNAFNPAIAVILNGQYAHHSQDPDHYMRAGFPVVEGTGPGPQGLSLGESEISFAANVDDKFYGQFTVSYHDNNGDVGAEIEEAYIDTLTLPDGFNLRAGRFFSNIGYLNSHHTHTDNFVDRPLAYQAFLGNQYGDDGAQVRWVAPTDTYLELGGEAFRGENYPSGGANHDGVGAWTLFAHAGGDVSDENSWLAGVSMLKSNTTLADDGFSGDETLYIADGTWKWAPNGNTKDGGLTLRSELFYDQRDGTYTQPNEVVHRPDRSADAAVDGRSARRVSRSGLPPQSHVGHRLPLRQALGAELGAAVRDRLRSRAPQHRGDLAQQRVQLLPPAVQPRRSDPQHRRQRDLPPVRRRARRARRAQVLTARCAAHLSERTTMNRFALFFVTIAAVLGARDASALDVFACEPEWGSLVHELAGDAVQRRRRHDRTAGRARDRSQAEPDREGAQAPISSSAPAPISKSAGCRS